MRDSVINRPDLSLPIERKSSLDFMQRIDLWRCSAAEAARVTLPLATRR